MSNPGERKAADTASPPALDPLVLGPTDGDAVWFRDTRVVVKCRAADTDGAYGLIEVWAPSDSGPALHVHFNEDEFFWILQGELEVRCGEDYFNVGPSGSAFLPRCIPHSYWVLGDQMARILIVISPGGGEEFFVSAGVPAKDSGLPTSSPVDVAALRDAARRFGGDIIGPPMHSTNQ